MAVVPIGGKSSAAKAFEAADAAALAGDAEPGNMTHHQLVAKHLALLAQADRSPPVAADGVLWQFDADSSLYRARDLEAIALDYGRSYPHEKRCKTRRDYLALAAHTLALSGDQRFFEDAPVGFAAGRAFFRVTPEGVIREELNQAHRQRIALPCEPEQGPAPRLEGFLQRAFNGDDATEQILRFGQMFGGVLTRALVPGQRAILLIGGAGAGKSTAARMLESLIPPKNVTATPPHQWGHEYYLASLVGSQLNLVGETSHTKPIPGAAFKSVLGGDLLQGRNPNHRPIEFRNTASHVFLANTFPPTDDRGDGFFRRWEIIEFRGRLSVAEMIPDFAESVIADELPQLLQFALEGAEMLAKQGGRFTPSATHDQLLLRWRMTASSVLEFLHDAEHCDLGAGLECPQLVLSQAYTRWCAEAGRRGIGRNKFYEEIDATGAVAGVCRKRGRGGAWIVLGVSVKGGAAW